MPAFSLPPVAGLRPRSAEDDTLDYAAVGLISDLEVHQQLLTARKLFCNCPAGRYTRVHDGAVLRHMRPTLSELGVYDAMQILQQAKTLLEAQVSKFSDETDRKRYVENIPWRRAIWYEEYSKAVDTPA